MAFNLFEEQLVLDPEDTLFGNSLENEDDIPSREPRDTEGLDGDYCDEMEQMLMNFYSCELASIT